MAIFETKHTRSFKADTESEAESIVEGFKANSVKEGYTVTKTKVDYKSKKDSRLWYNIQTKRVNLLII